MRLGSSRLISFLLSRNHRQGLTFFQRLALNIIGVVLISVGIMGVINYAQMRNALLFLGKEAVKTVCHGVYDMVDLEHGVLGDQVLSGAQLLYSELENEGMLKIDRRQPVRMRLVDMASGRSEEQDIPQLLLGGEALNGDNRLLERLEKAIGTESCILQLTHGKLVVIATSMENKDDESVLGYFLTSSSPAYKAIVNGDEYTTSAHLFGKWYVVAYKPLQDASGRIVGAVLAARGVWDKNIEHELQNVTLSGLGYVFVFNSRGEYIFHPYIDTSAHNVRDFNVPGLMTADREFVHYQWDGEHKAAYVTYFEPWDWHIAYGLKESEMTRGLDRKMLWTSILSAFVAIIIGLLMILFSMRSVLHQLGTGPEELQDITDEVARGNLAVSFEKGRLYGVYSSLRDMVRRLSGMAERLQDTGLRVGASATRINTQARQLESTVAEQNASTNEVGATSKEISATAAELVDTMSGVSSVAAKTADLAGEGRVELDDMREVMSRLQGATRMVSSKLAAIAEKADTINSVVDTISRVADQTNLLSLNAAIEAEKAGEYGLGFSVVAREIRRLADLTESSTRDIETIVSQMHQAVSSGVSEMERFKDEVLAGGERVVEISEKLESIISSVQELEPRFSAVTEGMEAQSVGAQQISEAMSQLTEAAAQTTESLHEFRIATEELDTSARNLEEEVSHFKVKKDD